MVSKKRPQIAWLVARARDVLRLLPPRGGGAPPLIIDACGGRGGLGLALAAALPFARVAVLDACAPAVAAGARAAEAAGLSNVAFLHAALPLPDGAAGLRAAAGGGAALLLGLHACGGLSDEVLALARDLGAAFCVAPCCFTKHGGCGAGPWGADVARALERLAESEHGGLRRPAMAAINSTRLHAHEGWAAPRLLAFPEELSAKNQVLWGVPRAWGCS